MLETEKTVGDQSNNYINRDWCFWYSHQRIMERTGGLGKKMTSGDHPNYCIFLDQQEYWEEPWRLAFTQTPVKSLSALADVKNSQGVNNDNKKKLEFDHTNR